LELLALSNPKGNDHMKTFALLFVLCLFASPIFAGETRTLNAPCEAAIVKAEVYAANRKWWPDRPDPKAPVLSIRTHRNFAKQAFVPFGVGSVWSHEKVGELSFPENRGRLPDHEHRAPGRRRAERPDEGGVCGAGDSSDYRGTRRAAGCESDRRAGGVLREIRRHPGEALQAL
jgi:hypothetical protein